MPAYDLSLGLGEDVGSVFGFLGLYDPLMLLAALADDRHGAEILFDCIVLFRLWGAGVSFLWYAQWRQASPKGAVAGAAVYVFSGYALLMANQYPSFSIPLLYLPLLLCGFDQLLQGGRPWTFLLSVVYAALTGFYFLYMCSLALAVYGVIRGGSLLGRQPLRWFGQLVRAVGWYLLGLALAAPAFLPMVKGYLNCGRSSSAYRPGNFWLVDADTAKTMLVHLFAGPWGFESPGLCAVALAALLMLFTHRGQRPLRFVCLLAVGLFFCPAFGYLMNGGGYISWRWTFLLAFLLGWAVAAQWERLLTARWWELALLFLCALAYFAGAWKGRNLFYLLAALMLALLILAMGLAVRTPRWGALLLCGAVAINAAGNLWMQNSPLGAGYASEFLYRGEWRERQTTPVALFETLQQETGLYRLDQPNSRKNASWAEGWYGTGIYISVLNRYYTERMLAWEPSPDIETNYDFTGLDRRAALESLLAVKYMILETSDPDIPAGFTPVEQRDRWTLYQNQNALPFVTAYTEYMLPEQVNWLSSVEQQQLALEAVTLETVHEDLNAVEGDTGCLWLEPTLELENARWEGSVLQAGEGACAVLTVDVPEPCELYLRLDDFSAAAYIANVTACAGQIERSARFFNEAHPEYYLTDGATFRLGQASSGATTLTVQFDPGAYTLGGFQVWGVPERELARRCAERAAAADTSLTLQRDGLQGSVAVAETSQLVFAIPYSSGWSLTLDGQPTATEPANGIFLSATVAPGAHSWQLTYRSPGRRTGWVLFAAAAALLAARRLWRKKTSA